MRVFVRLIRHQYSLPLEQGAATQPYVVFTLISSRALPDKIDPGSDRHDLINWYFRSKLAQPRVKKVWYQLSSQLNERSVAPEVQIVKLPFPRISNFKFILFYTLSSIHVLLAFFSILFGRWSRAVLLEEFILLEYVRLVPVSSRAVEYVFHNNNKSVRPLWTHEVSATGSMVTCLLYSHHIGIIDPYHAGQDKSDIAYRYLTWGRYAVWDREHADMIARHTGTDAEFVDVGPITVLDGNADLPPLPENAVALFDVNPIHPVREIEKGLLRPYHSLETCLAFLDTSCRIIRELSGVPVLKTKGPLDGTYYRSDLFEQLLKKYDCIHIDAGVSAYRLSRQCRAVIAAPFTSVPGFSALTGVTACFFDPTELLKDHPRYTCGAHLVVGETELIAWLSPRLAKGSQHLANKLPS